MDILFINWWGSGEFGDQILGCIAVGENTIVGSILYRSHTSLFIPECITVCNTTVTAVKLSGKQNVAQNMGKAKAGELHI